MTVRFSHIQYLQIITGESASNSTLIFALSFFVRTAISVVSRVSGFTRQKLSSLPQGMLTDVSKGKTKCPRQSGGICIDLCIDFY